MEPAINFEAVILYFICFIIAAFIAKWIFRTDKIFANSCKQYKLIKLMAEKMGVDELDIKMIDDFEEYKRLKRIRDEHLYDQGR